MKRKVIGVGSAEEVYERTVGLNPELTFGEMAALLAVADRMNKRLKKNAYFMAHAKPIEKRFHTYLRVAMKKLKYAAGKLETVGTE